LFPSLLDWWHLAWRKATKCGNSVAIRTLLFEIVKILLRRVREDVDKFGVEMMWAGFGAEHLGAADCVRHARHVAASRLPACGPPLAVAVERAAEVRFFDLGLVTPARSR
jgi:hypothetical protein